MSASPSYFLSHSASDQIQISGLSVRAVIGIFDDERTRRQELLLDFLIDTDVRRAASTDDIASAVDYKTLTKRVLRFVEASQFFLIETLAERIAELVLLEFPVSRLTVSVQKPGALRHAESVGVRITRSREDNS